MISTALLFATLCAAAAAPTPPPPATKPADPAFHLKSGDRVVFYGDSITDARMYTTFVETFVLTRFPELDVRFVHSGWGGDRVTGGGGGSVDLRLRRDVFAHNPTVVTVMLGMNDGRYKPYDKEIYDTFTKGYEHLFSAARAALPKARFTLIEPSPYDEITRPSTIKTSDKSGTYNDVLVKFGAFVKGLAAKSGPLVDSANLNRDLLEVLKKANEADHETALKLIPDRVHPGTGGHLIMAGSLLSAWHAPALVSSVEIDGAAGKLARARGATVVGVSKTGGLRWTETDRALPMPVDFSDATVALAMQSSTFTDRLNQQPLKITGLGAGAYAVRIDGAQVGVWKGPALAKGINLAVLPTPMVRQAAEVHNLTLAHNEIHFARWRSVELRVDGRDPPEAAAALAALDRLEDALVLRQRAAARPRPHTYEVVAVPDAAASVPLGFSPIFGNGDPGRVLLSPQRRRNADVYLEMAGGCEGDGQAAVLLRLRDGGEAFRVSLDCRETGGTLGRIDAVGYRDVKPTPTPAFRDKWKKDGWNTVRVRVEGYAPQIKVWLNGNVLSELKMEQRQGEDGADMEDESTGYVALQLTTATGARAPAVRNVALKPEK